MYCCDLVTLPDKLTVWCGLQPGQGTSTEPHPKALLDSSCKNRVIEDAHTTCFHYIFALSSSQYFMGPSVGLEEVGLS